MAHEERQADVAGASAPRVSGAPSAEAAEAAEEGKGAIWDWPLRLWHWAFAACVVFCLCSGLYGDIDLAPWHMRSGLALVGLLVFRLAWAVWGGLYARWRHYWTTPRALWLHFRGRAPATLAHTAPGTALALLFAATVTAQVASGLFTTDDILHEGPLFALASDGLARSAAWLHRRLHWVILGGVSAHLAANAVYAFAMRDSTPLAMFTGRKPKSARLPSTPHFWLRAGLTVLLAAGVVAVVVCADRF